MKKLLSLGILFLLSLSVFAIEGYEMKTEPCSDDNTYDACRYEPDEFCSISEQTFCDDPPTVGGWSNINYFKLPSPFWEKVILNRI